MQKSGKIRLKVGDRLPAVVLPSTANRNVNLMAEAEKHHLVLFFYPGDREGLRYSELAGCTPEACAFQTNLEQFRQLNTIIFSINLHSTERQQQFVEREHLTFELLSDRHYQLLQGLGIPLWRSTTGEVFVVRTTFVIAQG